MPTRPHTIQLRGDSEATLPVGQIKRDTLSGEDSDSRVINPFGTMLDRIGLGFVVLDDHRRVIGWNSRAKDALNIVGAPKDVRNLISTAFKQLIADTQCQLSPGTLCWIVIAHLSRPIIVHEKGDFLRNGESVVFLLTRDTRPKANGLRLQKLFGLTGAETKLALNIACGQTLLEIAKSRNISRTTIRSQLASLFAKTDTRRQSELMALLIRMSVLP